MHCTPLRILLDKKASWWIWNCPDDVRQKKLRRSFLFLKCQNTQTACCRAQYSSGLFSRNPGRMKWSISSPGLQDDLCVSRTLSWGVPVTFDPGHVVYVWTMHCWIHISRRRLAGGEWRRKPSRINTGRRMCIHGKHYHPLFIPSIKPIILMAFDLPPPEHVCFGHGWILLKVEKCSNLWECSRPSWAPKIRRKRCPALSCTEMTYGADGIYNEDCWSHINLIHNDL